MTADVLPKNFLNVSKCRDYVTILIQKVRGKFTRTAMPTAKRKQIVFSFYAVKHNIH